MDLELSDEQRALVTSFDNLLAKAAPPEAVRAAEPGGFDEDLWGLLLGTGALFMALPEDRGGWGATLLDLAIVAELLGRYLAPAPLIESQVAARLLAKIATREALDALQSALHGDRIVTVALHPPREGVATLTPAGAVCDAVITFDGASLSLTPVAPCERRPVANLGASPLADLTLGESLELVAGPGAVESFAVATDEWLVLTAAALVGLSMTAHEIVCGYVRGRRAFGQVVGSYQGVAHPLANDATELDGARLLVHEVRLGAGNRSAPRARAGGDGVRLRLGGGRARHL